MGCKCLSHISCLTSHIYALSKRNMSELPLQGPVEEQSICVRCGFCCDGTLFLHAVLNSDERGHLPEKIEQNSYSEAEKDYFRLPCHYFSEKCTIYDRARADVCGSYRCQVLNDFADGKIILTDAMEVVREAMSIRTEIIDEYRRISGNNGDINFKQILIELGKTQKSVSERKAVSMDYEMLLARCNIFETLLIKHFRSAENFEKMIMK